MKISYADYIKKTDASVLIAEAIFSELELKCPIKSISDVAQTISGGTPLRSNYDYHGGDIPWLKSGELNDGAIDKAEEFITKKGLANSSAKLHPTNTLLLAMYGATAGRTGITKIEASTNQAVCALFPNEEVTQEYLFWFLRQHRYKFIEISKGGAQPNISQSVINDTKIPVPEKKLQKQISDILSKIENEGILDISIIPKEFREKVNKVFISKNNVFEIDAELTHQLSLVKKLRQQLLQDAVQGKLVEQNKKDEPASELLKKIKVEKGQLIKAGKLKKEKELLEIKEEEIPFEIPENWVWCRLGEICTKITDGTHFSPLNVGTGKYKYITAKNIKDSGIELSKISYVSEDVHREIYSRCNPEVGDILYIKDGATTGVVTINNLKEEFSMLSSVALIKLPSLISNDFLKYMMRSPFYYKTTRDDMSGVAITRVTLEKIQKAIVPLPPFLEQKRIVNKLELLMQNCNELEESIKQSALQNEKLLQQVLREALQK